MSKITIHERDTSFFMREITAVNGIKELPQRFKKKENIDTYTIKERIHFFAINEEFRRGTRFIPANSTSLLTADGLVFCVQ